MAGDRLGGGNRYFRRRWDDSRGDNYASWGCATYYFEVDELGCVRRQIEEYDQGPKLRYNQNRPEDRYGRLASGNVIDDESTWGACEIPASEFEDSWKSSPDEYAVVSTWTTIEIFDGAVKPIGLYGADNRSVVFQFSDEWGDINIMGIINTPDRQPLLPASKQTGVSVQLLGHQSAMHLLHQGATFALWMGKVIGEGRIEKVNGVNEKFDR